MLKTDDFPSEYLPNLTEQVNNWLGDMIRSGQLRRETLQPDDPVDPADGGAGSYELGERFVMLFLKDPEIRAVKSLDRDLSELVTPTGRRHYQLKHNQNAFAYARSLINKNEELCQLFATKLAENLQEAIVWLDAYERDHPNFAANSWRVRLVTIPTFHTHAFLIQKIENGDQVAEGASYVFVVSAPHWLEKLPRERLLNSREFLMGFEGEKPIIGVPQSRRVVNKSQPQKEQINMAEEKSATESAVENPPGLGGGEGHSTLGGALGNPIFASLIFPFVKKSDGQGMGGGEGHISTLGGPPEGVDPLFVVFTYNVPPKVAKEDISHS